jgi:hypothetical protein
MSVREAGIGLERFETVIVSMIALLEVTRSIIVAIDGTGGSWCCVSEVTLVGRVTQRTRSYFTLLTEARLFRAWQLGTIWIYTAVTALFLLCVAVRIQTGVRCAALILSRARHHAVLGTGSI